MSKIDRDYRESIEQDASELYQRCQGYYYSCIYVQPFVFVSGNY